MGSFEFGTKAETLEGIACGRSYTVLPVVRVHRPTSEAEAGAAARRILATLGDRALIVRSSAVGEDSENESHAGQYESVLDVRADGLVDAVQRVFGSYPCSSPLDEVLVQPMADGIVRSGVAMTCDPVTGAAYFVVNYSDGSDTEAVTSGAPTSSWSVVADNVINVPEEAAVVCRALQELISITGHTDLDIEFGQTADGRMVIFQVRKITTVSSKSRSKQRKRLSASIDRALANYAAAQGYAEHFGLGHSLLGVMPDWNPAELIGLKPRPLAYSLYETIITTDSWAVGRTNLGYKNLRSVPLMHQIGGSPFIMVAASLTSLLPAAVDDEVGRQIVSIAQRRLGRHPELHDKIEFEVMPTCYKPSLSSDRWRRRFAEIDDKAWAAFLASLLDMTNRIISTEETTATIHRRAQELDAAIEKTTSGTGSDLLIDALAFLQTARVYGTELFAEVARAAFIATDILSDLERVGVVPVGFLDATVAAASSISTQLVSDHATLPTESFLQRHGHVRPGTYDVTVPRYDAAPESYLDNVVTNVKGADERSAPIGPNPDAIAAHLVEIGYSFTWHRFQSFARAVIALREEVKHSFTKLLSEAMEVLVRCGEIAGLSRDDVSFITVADARLAADFPDQSAKLLAEAVRRNRRQWKRDFDVRLPALIVNERDIVFSQERVAQPTFVTQYRAEADVTVALRDSLRGKIVCIERADPGFDWLFTREIAGFITRFGGENSHMAIRARELKIPAVIGAGNRFDTWAAARRLIIDGGTKTVEVIA